MNHLSFPFPHTWDTARYARALQMGGQSEDEVQLEIIQEIGSLGMVLWHTDAGDKKARGRVQKLLRGAGHTDLAKDAAKVKGTSGLPAGFSDLHGALAPYGRAVYLEVKRPGLFDQVGKCLRKPGLPTPEQLEFLLSMHNLGAVVGVVWSLSDALAILRPHLGAHCGHLRALRRPVSPSIGQAVAF